MFLPLFPTGVALLLIGGGFFVASMASFMDNNSDFDDKSRMKRMVFLAGMSNCGLIIVVVSLVLKYFKYI